MYNKTHTYTHTTYSAEYEYLDIILDSGDKVFECTPSCIPEHGNCIPLGLCACSEGWTGTDCADGNNYTNPFNNN